jgi:hypothetical protein
MHGFARGGFFADLGVAALSKKSDYYLQFYPATLDGICQLVDSCRQLLAEPIAVLICQF